MQGTAGEAVVQRQNKRKKIKSERPSELVPSRAASLAPQSPLGSAASRAQIPRVVSRGKPPWHGPPPSAPHLHRCPITLCHHLPQLGKRAPSWAAEVLTQPLSRGALLARRLTVSLLKRALICQPSGKELGTSSVLRNHPQPLSPPCEPVHASSARVPSLSTRHTAG